MFVSSCTLLTSGSSGVDQHAGATKQSRVSPRHQPGEPDTAVGGGHGAPREAARQRYSQQAQHQHISHHLLCHQHKHHPDTTHGARQHHGHSATTRIRWVGEARGVSQKFFALLQLNFLSSYICDSDEWHMEFLKIQWKCNIIFVFRWVTRNFWKIQWKCNIIFVFYSGWRHCCNTDSAGHVTTDRFVGHTDHHAGFSGRQPPGHSSTTTSRYFNP